MKKIAAFVFISLLTLELHSQWLLLNNNFCPNVAISAFENKVVAGQTLFGPVNLLVSSDAGITWDPGNFTQSNEVLHLTHDGTFVYACTPDGVFRSSQNMSGWTSFNEGLPAGKPDKICVHGDLLLVEGVFGIYRRSINDNSWTIVCETSPVGGVYDFDFDGNRIVLAGYNGVAESTDMGLNWLVWNNTNFEFTAVGLIGDLAFAASKGGVYRKTFSTGAVTKVCSGLTQLWNPYGYEYYGEFEMFHKVNDLLFLCGETGVYKLGNNNGFWDFTGLGAWTYALTDNGATLFAAKGYQGIWGCDLEYLMTNTNENVADGVLFQIYPNPVTAEFTINAQKSITEALIVSVCNLEGREIFHAEMMENFESFDVSTLAEGIYFIKVSNGHTVSTLKFVKQ